MLLVKVLGVLTLFVSGVGAAVMGAASSAFRTREGREVMSRRVIAALNGAIDGSATVSSLDGSFTEGLIARDVVIRDEHGILLAELPQVQIRYRLRDLLGGRVVLGQLTLTSPTLSFVQLPGEQLNLARVLRLGGQGTGGSSPLIAFRDVEIANGRILIRTPAGEDDDPAHEFDVVRGVKLRVRRIESLNARLPYVRFSSPLPGQKPIRFDIEHLRAQVSDPRVTIIGMRGVAHLRGDSLTLDLPEVELRDSRIKLKGVFTWPSGPLLYDLELRGDPVASADVLAFQPFPPGLSGRGTFFIRSEGEDRLVVFGENLAFAGKSDGGSFDGRLGIVLGAGDSWSFENISLRTKKLDLQYVRPLLDTLPILGRLSGTFHAAGPRERLEASVDWTFSDSLVPGWPRSTIRGNGLIALGVSGGLVFGGFEVDRAQLDLGTVHRLIPAVEIRGSLSGSGMLRGPWRELEFTGALRHEDPGLPASAATGVVKIDSRGDTLGVWANLDFDSLNFDGIRPTYPDVPLIGPFGGEVQLNGYLDSLSVYASLASQDEEFEFAGNVTLLDQHRGGRNLEIGFANLRVHQLRDSFPETRITGGIRGRFDLAARQAPVTDFAVDLGPSYVLGAPIDSARGFVVAADSILTIDNFKLWTKHSLVVANGAVGIRAPSTSALVLTARFDSVGIFQPILASVLQDIDSSLGLHQLTGSAAVKAEVMGELAEFRVLGEVSVEGVRWSGLSINRLRANGLWERSETKTIWLDAEVDTVALGELSFADIRVLLNGARDSLHWEGRGRSGSDTRVVARGNAVLDRRATTFEVESAIVELPTHVWNADSGAIVAVSDSAFDFGAFALTSASGEARVSLSGRVPRRGPGDLDLTVVGLPLKDVWAVMQRSPEDVEGDLGGSLSLSGTAREPFLRVALRLRGARFGEFRPPYVVGTLDYGDRRVTGDLSLWRLGDSILTVTVDLPLDLAFGEVHERKLPGQLSVRARADGLNLEFLNGVTPLVLATTGRLDADLGITGTWERPQLTGVLAVTNGTATFPALGVRHEALNARAVLTGDTVWIEQLSLVSGRGRATVAGYIRLEELTKPVLELDIEAENFNALDIRRFLTLNATGNMRLSGPLFGATLTGGGTLTSGVFNFADLLEKDIIKLEDTQFAGLIDTSLISEVGLGREFPNRFLDSLRIDSLQVRMGSEMWLRSSEANFQLAGDLVVRKVGDEYRLDGTLTTPRGNYRLPLGPSGAPRDLVTREFDVTSGEIRYFGTPDLDADLDIDARHVVRTVRRENVTVFVHIGGTLYAPRLTLSSDAVPPLSETEIISYLLFRAPSFQALTTETEGRNARIFQQALSNFFGGLSGQIERSLIADLGVPIDYLAIRPVGVAGIVSGQDAAQVAEIAVGWQLGSKTFLTASPRLCIGRQQRPENIGASIEYRLSRNWLLAASYDPLGACGWVTQTGVERQLGADLFWEKSF